MKSGENYVAVKTAELASIAARIREHIARNILFVDGQLPFADDDSFLDNGVIDSTGILELQLFVEEGFGIKVRDEEVVPDNFDSISQLTGYVNRKLRAR